MEMKQLEAFCAVARHLSFSRAAKELFLSQPTISAQIAALEQKLGVQLVARTTKEIALTPAGRDFAVYAGNILALRDRALQEFGAATPARGTLHILSSTVPAQHLLPEVVAAFRRDHPKVVFHVDQADSRAVMEGMTGFRYDFGFVGTAPADPRFVHHPVYLDKLVLALPQGLRAEPDAIRRDVAAFLRSHPILMREQGSGTRYETENLFAKLGITPQGLDVAAYFADTHSILQAVAQGLGIALVSKVSAALHIDAGLIAAVEVNSDLFARQIHLLYRRELTLSPLQQAFADFVRGFYHSA